MNDGLFFFVSIGDGAGVGKGRTIAGIIFENYLRGRKKAIWISVSNDLKYDAERDLRDIGASNINVHPLNKVIRIVCATLVYLATALFWLVHQICNRCCRNFLQH